MTRPRARWVLAGIAVTSVAAGVTAFALLRPAELPQDWSGKSRFCQTAQQFGIEHFGHFAKERINPVDMLQSLRREAPSGLHADLDVLITAATQPPGTEERVKPQSTRVGLFIESRCGVNLPGIIT